MQFYDVSTDQIFIYEEIPVKKVGGEFFTWIGVSRVPTDYKAMLLTFALMHGYTELNNGIAIHCTREEFERFLSMLDGNAVQLADWATAELSIMLGKLFPGEDQHASDA